MSGQVRTVVDDRRRHADHDDVGTAGDGVEVGAEASGARCPTAIANERLVDAGHDVVARAQGRDAARVDVDAVHVHARAIAAAAARDRPT